MEAGLTYHIHQPLPCELRKTAMALALVLIIVIFLGPVTGQQCGENDMTLQEYAKGQAVVEAAVSKIEASGIFRSGTEPDKAVTHRFLRRVAYVETNDGDVNPNLYSRGGIWQLNMSNFLMINRALEVPSDLLDKVDEIKTDAGNQLFGGCSEIRVGDRNINIDDLEWTAETYPKYEDLTIPILSALAVRLYIFILGEDIPLARDITEQALYWKAHYNTSGSTDLFESRVTELSLGECRVNSDLIFVLDTSGSIGPENFNKVREFVHNFTSGLQIGPNDNQVGVITYDYVARVEFNLSEHQSLTQLQTAIDDIYYYHGPATNTPDGLCQLIDIGFTLDAGARLDETTVLRIGIVMTDGQSNRASDSPSCSSVAEAAARVHSFQPPILVYAIGVGSGINEDELNAIATQPELIDRLESFDSTSLSETQEEQTYHLCFKASTPLDANDTSMNGTLGENESTRYEIQLPEDGLTIRLCVHDGVVVLYTSTVIPNPNEAFYEQKLECNSCFGCELFILPSASTTVQQQKRQINTENNSTDEVTVYLSVEGQEENNVFMFENTAGNTLTPTRGTASATPHRPVDEEEIWYIVGGAVAGGVVLLLMVILMAGWIMWAGRK